MALAILELVDLNDRVARFRVDTGTNRWFSIRIGREVGERGGYRWVEDLLAETQLRENPNGGGLLRTSHEVSVPLPPERPDRGRAAGDRGRPWSAQLSTFRTSARVGPAFSDVVALAPKLWASDPDFSLPESAQMEPTVKTESFLAPRAVPCRTHAEQMTAPALGDLLTEIMRIAGPIVAGLLGGSAGAGQPPANSPATSAAAAPMLLGLLEALLRQVPGVSAVPASTGQSLPSGGASRFANGRDYAEPFIFGIDDALLGAVIGQVVQVLPQLANAAGQQRVQLQADRNKLVGDIVGDVQQRILLTQLLEAQRQAPAGQAPELSQLIALLGQAGASAGAGTTAPVTTGATAPVTAGTTAPVTTGATGQSLSLEPAPAPSARATAVFLTGPPVQYAGRDHVLLARGRAVRLSVQLVVGAPAPTAPLPRAIVRVVIKRADQTVVAEQVVKQRDLAAGATVPVTFTAADLAAAPAGEPVLLLAEIRWPAGGRILQATGGTEAVFVDGFFVKQRGAPAGPERELVDMDRYRAFWNKVWESPVLDAATGGERKLLWGLDATLKYCVLVVGGEASNGVMQTRVLRAAAPGAREVREQIVGRMKGGAELSVDELNKLATLWDGGAPLDDARLGAMRSPTVTAAGGEVIERLKLEGKAAERGIVWAVPVLAPVSFTLGSVQGVDDAGQVTGIGEEQVRMPLPVAVRILGVTSSKAEGGDEAEADDDATYRFDGFAIRVSDKIALTPKGSAADG
jgi:hypothetical protein